MIRRNVSVALSALGVLAGWASPRPAAAQDSASASRFSGAFEFGGRFFTKALTDQQRGWFELYSHTPKGAVLPAFRLGYASADGFRSLEFAGTQIGERDQSVWLRAKQPGLIDVQLQWDRLPHTYSTTARSLGSVSGAGAWTLPVPRPDSAAFANAPYLAAIRTQWDPVRLRAHYTPSDRWDLSAQYTWIGKKGERPMGMAFGGPGNNTREIAEPIDQTMQGFRLSPSFSTHRVQFGVTYDFSRFDNQRTSVTADNPVVATSTAAGGSAQGRSALAPGNLAHTVSATGGLTLPVHTRVTATATFSWRRQSEAFIAPTINPALTDPRFGQLPAKLDGDARTTVVNVTAASRPVRQLSLTARYRHFDYADRTPVLFIPVFAVNDRSISDGDSAFRFPYSKDNAAFAAAWRFGRPATLTASYAWEGWTRDTLLRETTVHHTGETIPKLALDVRGADWLTLRASVLGGRRRGDGYHQFDDAEVVSSRRFDQADRDRRRFDLEAAVSPAVAPVTVTATYTAARDTFPDSQYGVQRQRSEVVGGSLDWAPSARFAVGLSYTRENDRSQQRNRLGNAAQINNLTYDRVVNTDDVIKTFGANVAAVLVPGRLEVGGDVEISSALLTAHARNPLPPAGGTAAQILQATAVDWPDITQKWVPAAAFVRVHVNGEWAVTGRYSYDRFRSNDFRNFGLLPATGADLFLGNQYLDYNGQFVTFTVSYRPRFLGMGRSAL